jgi:hypothetical protein
MFRIKTVILLIISIVLSSQVISDDLVDGYIPPDNFLTEQTRSMLEEIKLAEDNDDWDTYNNLRADFINHLKQTNSPLASSYKTIRSDYNFTNIDGFEKGKNTSNSSGYLNEEFPTRTIPEKWGDDVSFRNGLTFRDFSMDVSVDGHIYVSAATWNSAPTTDSLIVYRSLDGGSTWDYWLTRTVGDGDYNKTEIMCFDSPSGDKYVLLFYSYTSGTINQRFRVVQYDQATGSIGGSATLVDSLVYDFAVDKNYPSLNYRAIAFYDSANWIYSIRSEPTSYGTVWQDKFHLGHVGEDVDLCYGLSGSVYATYNGYSSGNLYVRENLNYADPASWSSAITLENGSTDTTMHAEVIATRESQASIKIQVVYTNLEGNSYNLRRAEKDDGGSWTANYPFVINASYDFIYPSLDIDHWGGTTEIHNAYRSYYNNDDIISYKFDSGSGWTGSVFVSDYRPTGTQKPYVAEVNGEPVVVYAGWGPNTLYCDNNGWVSSITGNKPNSVSDFNLFQNYPNPFNPSTKIKYQIAGAKSQNTKLQIFNSLGQLVRTLVNAEQANGDYSVVWDGLDNNGKEVSSGIYIYTLIHGNLISSKKLVKLK